MNNTGEKNIAIAVSNLGITFETEKNRSNLNLQFLRSFFQNSDLPQKLNSNWVFRNLDFSVFKGEVIGIIGKNGCGKTTLLKIISRVLFPSEGSVKVYGSVASLLGVGTGFHNEYTGRENIILNGQLLGIKKANIEKVIDQIIEFSELDYKIDHPVKTYSSGMKAKLAFSVATLLDADIIILDEVLSVGDAGFQKKCLNEIQKLKESGKTIIIVSHSMASIEQFCDRAILIQNGGIVANGIPSEVTSAYLGQFKDTKEGVPLKERSDRYGNGQVLITDLYIHSKGQQRNIISSGEDATVTIEYEVKDKIFPQYLKIGVGIKDKIGRPLVRLSTDVYNIELPCNKRKGIIEVQVANFPFSLGNYSAGFRLLAEENLSDHIPNAITFEVIEGNYFGTGISDNHSPLYVSHEWSIK